MLALWALRPTSAVALTTANTRRRPQTGPTRFPRRQHARLPRCAFSQVRRSRTLPFRHVWKYAIAIERKCLGGWSHRRISACLPEALSQSKGKFQGRNGGEGKEEKEISTHSREMMRAQEDFLKGSFADPLFVLREHVYDVIEASPFIFDPHRLLHLTLTLVLLLAGGLCQKGAKERRW